MTIEGHCDERGTEAYNLALGTRRATTVKAYLTALGLPAARLSVVSYGKTRPFCTDADETCYRLNRRAHLILNTDGPTVHHSWRTIHAE